MQAMHREKALSPVDWHLRLTHCLACCARGAGPSLRTLRGVVHVLARLSGQACQPWLIDGAESVPQAPGRATRWSHGVQALQCGVSPASKAAGLLEVDCRVLGTFPSLCRISKLVPCGCLPWQAQTSRGGRCLWYRPPSKAQGSPEDRRGPETALLCPCQSKLLLRAHCPVACPGKGVHPLVSTLLYRNCPSETTHPAL